LGAVSWYPTLASVTFGADRKRIRGVSFHRPLCNARAVSPWLPALSILQNMHCEPS
jgi:hypothetical protein